MPVIKKTYIGMTFPKNQQGDKKLEEWRKTHCRKGRHLFDECLSQVSGHTLHCDACGLSVRIQSIDFKYVDDHRVKNHHSKISGLKI